MDKEKLTGWRLDWARRKAAGRRRLRMLVFTASIGGILIGCAVGGLVWLIAEIPVTFANNQDGVIRALAVPTIFAGIVIGIIAWAATGKPGYGIAAYMATMFLVCII